jgi:hypothetical protein
MKQEESNKIITITLTVLLGVFLQVVFGFADSMDTPNKAVAEFAKAYYQFDKNTLTARLCNESQTADDVNTVDRYVYNAHQKAESLGYGMYYMKEKLYDLKTYTVEKTGYTKAKIRLVCERKPPLQSFFTGRPAVEVDEIFDVVLEEGRWKVCGNPFSLNEG